MENFEKAMTSGNQESAGVPAVQETESGKNEKAVLVEQYFELQLEILELNKVLNASVNDAIKPENEGKKKVYTSVGRRFHKMIEDATSEKEVIEHSISAQGLDPKEYILQ